MGLAVQVVPFHEYAIGDSSESWLTPKPTAMQNAGVVHDVLTSSPVRVSARKAERLRRPRRAVPLRDDRGEAVLVTHGLAEGRARAGHSEQVGGHPRLVVTTVQADPFHCSTRTSGEPIPAGSHHHGDAERRGDAGDADQCRRRRAGHRRERHGRPRRAVPKLRVVSPPFRASTSPPRPVTATQNTEVTQETAPACVLLSGAATVFAMLVQVDALTVAGEERRPRPPIPLPWPGAVRSRRGHSREHRIDVASACAPPPARHSCNPTYISEVGAGLLLPPNSATSPTCEGRTMSPWPPSRCTPAGTGRCGAGRWAAQRRRAAARQPQPPHARQLRRHRVRDAASRPLRPRACGSLHVPCHRFAALHAGAPRHPVRLARLPLATVGLHRGLGGAHHPTAPAGRRDDHAGVGPPAPLRGGGRELPHGLQRLGVRTRARGRPVADVSRSELHRLAGAAGPWRRVVLAGSPGLGGRRGSTV